jgi:sulfopyruvate decarboxylase TPP-binding subunit
VKNQSEIPKLLRKFEFQMPQNYLRGLMASINQIAKLDSTYKVEIHVLMETKGTKRD